MYYLMNKITETTFKEHLIKNEKIKTKNEDLNNIYRMFCDVATENMANIINTKNIDDNLTNIIRLIEYVNESFSKFGAKYNTVVYPCISDRFILEKHALRYLAQK